MDTRQEQLYKALLAKMQNEPTPCQDRFFRQVSDFVLSDADVMVLNGYAGTGKTTAIACLVAALKSLKIKSVLLAPTGRAAKVLSLYAGAKAYTVHKHIYRQKTVGSDGFGQFTLSPNKDRNTLFVVDEVSLMGNEETSAQSTVSFGTGHLLDDLLTFVRNGVNCKVLLVGDSAQLPPVGLDESPALSREYMNILSDDVSFCELTTVVRQKDESGILYNATLLRNIIDSEPYDIDYESLGLEISPFSDIERISGGELIEKISDAYSRYGEDETVILCRSNRRANRYNAGIRSMVQYKEERLVKDDKLMIVKNCYQFVEDIPDLDYIANGDIALLVKISKYEDRYGLHFAQARLRFPDYDDQEIEAKVILDTLESESASLTHEQSNALYLGVNQDYSHITSKKKRYDAVREDKYFNALQLKYAGAITCHKAQGGQWDCVFIDNPFWQENLTVDDLKWLYTAITRAKTKVYLVNFKDEMFCM